MIDTETSKEYEYQLIDQQLIDIYKSDTISIYQNDLKHKNKTAGRTKNFCKYFFLD